MTSKSNSTTFAVGMTAPWTKETNNVADHTIRPAYILYLPRELLDKVISKLSQRD